MEHVFEAEGKETGAGGSALNSMRVANVRVNHKG